jgi:hypothetical protein
MMKAFLGFHQPRRIVSYQKAHCISQLSWSFCPLLGANGQSVVVSFGLLCGKARPSSSFATKRNITKIDSETRMVKQENV